MESETLRSILHYYYTEGNGSVQALLQRDGPITNSPLAFTDVHCILCSVYMGQPEGFQQLSMNVKFQTQYA